jgi:hypothetical protein
MDILAYYYYRVIIYRLRKYFVIMCAADNIPEATNK